jgi:hypothetical protein
MATMTEIPKEFYYIIGSLVVANAAALLGFLKSYAKKELQHEQLIEQMAKVQSKLDTQEMQLIKLKTDVDFSFEKIRQLMK